eukprot:3473392-Pyramimonas_sp.AAC.1
MLRVSGAATVPALANGCELGLDADMWHPKEELTGELNFRVMRRLSKVLTVNFTVAVPSPGANRARGRLAEAGRTEHANADQ